MTQPATIPSLTQDLRERCHVAPAQVLIVHSSMKAIGAVEGGPRAVVEALQLSVGEQGTLLMPTFADPAQDGRFDVRLTPSRTGVITEVFRTMPGVRRSRHVTHAVAAWGRRRDELLDGHEDTPGLGVLSPFHLAALPGVGARVLMIGCDLTTCSVVHVAEAIVRVPYLGRAWYPGYDRALTLVDEAGAERLVEPRDPPGDSSQFVKVAALLERRGQLQRGRLGEATCLLFKASDAIDAAVSLLVDDPLALLCRNPRCAYCTMARRAVALSGWAGPTPPPHRASADASAAASS